MSLCCDRNMNDVISTRKMSSENMRRSWVFSGIFLVEMPSFMFPSQYRDTKAIFYLFYKITKVFSSFHDIILIHVSVLCTLIQNENDINCISVLWEKIRLIQSEHAQDACYFINNNIKMCCQQQQSKCLHFSVIKIILCTNEKKTLYLK